MKRLLFTFLALCLAVAGSAQSGQMTSKLPTIDITKEYPKKKLVLQDIATAEYIPLETSDKVLLDGVATLHCSFTEHYITTYNANEGQIFVFDRKGKICHTFNHKGGSGEEYNYSLSIPKDVRIEIMYNCDEQHLLGYDSYMLDRKDKQPNSRPYLLISKKNGAVSRLPVTIHKRVGKRIYITQGGQTATVSMSLYPLANSGSEFIFADLAGDTVYSYYNHKLTPLFVRTPKADASEPRLVMQCYAKIGNYLLMSTALKKYEPGKTSFDTKEFVYDTVEKKVYDLEFENQDYSPARSMRMGGVLSALPEKCVFDSWDTDRLLDMLEKGKLTGNLKKVAEKMTVDDNPLLILYKFK